MGKYCIPSYIHSQLFNRWTASRARSRAVVITGAPAGAKQKEIASIFRPFRALIHRFSNLRAAPGAIFLSAFQAGLIHFAPTGMYRKNSHRLALSITPMLTVPRVNMNFGTGRDFGDTMLIHQPLKPRP